VIVPDDPNPVHPEIDCWTGGRGWSAPGEAASSLVSFDTDDDIEPFKMTHNRDLIYDGGRLEQDYNFIDYYFGDPTAPVQARHYLDSHEVTIDPPERTHLPQTADEAALLLDPAIIRYFKKRFRSVLILTADAYQELWCQTAQDTELK
jgi:hypothetical protein